MVNDYIKLAMIELEKGNYEKYEFYMAMNRESRVKKELFFYDDFQEEQFDESDWDELLVRNNNDKKIWRWSEWEREYLELNYLKKSDKEIAEKLNRPINGIQWQRRKLELKKPLNWKKID